jgi:hypothetical protein
LGAIKVSLGGQQYSAMVTDEDSAFVSAYTFEIDPEFPGDGRWDCPVVGFDRTGAAMANFDSRWGTPFVVRIRPDGGEEWVAMLAAGGLGGLREAFVTPNPHLLAAAVDGLVYLLDVRSPGGSVQILHDQVQQVVPIGDPPVRGQFPVRGFGHQMSAPLAVMFNSR